MSGQQIVDGRCGDFFGEILPVMPVMYQQTFIDIFYQ